MLYFVKSNSASSAKLVWIGSNTLNTEPLPIPLLSAQILPW
jgi:hypothetical protein